MNASSSTGSSIDTPVSRPAKGPGRLRFESKYRNSRQPERASSESSRRSNGSHRNAARCEVFLRLADGVLAEVEDRGGQHGAGAAVGETFVQMFEGADTAAGDDRDGHGAPHRPEQLAVVAGLRAVTIQRREQDLAGAEADDLLGPGDGVEAGRLAAAVGVD